MKNQLYLIIKENFKLIIISASIAFFISFLFLKVFFLAVVDGTSMENTLHTNDIILIYTNAYKNNNPKYKDIVNIYVPEKYENYLVKRIIGIPNDKLEVKNNKLYINETFIEEVYIKEPMKNNTFSLFVPKNKYFVMGDNRNISLDSRTFGFVDKNEIHGKVIFKFCSKKFNFSKLYNN
ncbi:signal peptidase I [Clostridium tarantellae]|uniref:Signal peptidase I n=1 Tax=Clostridium tarantellae TaxID=39493 RepID=A0A6I1MT37_9CLOT|nr:signal peptidase I [Clostridium tarantellae]MPQ45327.1 signal peptidase I [Clostridium tarantellae]